MSTVTADALIRLLQRNPDGMTSRQVAEAVKANRTTIASRLSKLALYGRIDRDIEQSAYAPGKGSQKWSRWRAKTEPAAWLPNIASPPT